MLLNTNGISIADLKRFLQHLPELDDDGDDYQVWLKSGDGVSSPCTAIRLLNLSDDGSDIMLSYSDDADIELTHPHDIKDIK